MLKFILSLVFLIPLSWNWGLVQFFVFFLFFIFSVSASHDFMFMNMGFMLGIDYLGYLLILLSFWITGLVLSASQMVYKQNNFIYMFLLMNILLLLFLVITFSCLDYLSFYISFEASLLPTLVLILGWGYQPERVQAGIYFFFYTMFASLPLLVSILFIYYNFGGVSMILNTQLNGGELINYLWYLVTVFAFIVKLPMFLVHLWLPKAHVEAPVAGSMILAGVLLKLGGYGLIRVLPVFCYFNSYLSWVWVSVSIVGGVVVSLMCLRQVDMKALVAYSSVAHMGLVLCGLVVFNWWGVNGALVVMIGHGLCSSGLFCLVNMVYERLSSRSLLVSKGLLNFMPSMGLWWFLLSTSNMAAPPTLNLLGEVSLILSVVSWSSFSLVGIGFLSFFSAAYTLYMYSISQHGKFFISLFSCCSGKVREYLVLLLHWLPLNFMILNGCLVIMG